MSALRQSLSRLVCRRAEIAEILADAVGAASILGLLILLAFLGEMFR